MQLSKTQNSKKILFIAPIGIGNVILLIPTIKECKEILRNSKITVIVANHQSQEILEECPYVDEVILLKIPACFKFSKKLVYTLT